MWMCYGGSHKQEVKPMERDTSAWKMHIKDFKKENKSHKKYEILFYKTKTFKQIRIKQKHLLLSHRGEI